MSSGIKTKTLAFGYDAAGNRVRKESMSGGTTTKQWYVRDAQGNIMSTYKQVGTGTLKQEYVYLYGSTRTGEYLLNRDSATLWNRHYYRVKGNRHYELTNHLGNVLAVVTDRKIAKDTTADLIYTPQFFMPDVYSVQNYYAFGQSMPKWSTTAAVNDPKKYRFGYNGKEDDDEWGKQDYGFRISDPRIGRFLSVDPLNRDYPELTPYQFASNMPIWAIDLDGLEAKIVFDKYYNNLHIIPDLSKTNLNLPYKYVTAVEYSNLTDDEKAKHNYGIKVENVFTGGHFDSQKKVIIYNDPTRPAELPISVGTYSILENKGNTEPSHDSFFVLDPVDSSPYDKIDDRPGETNYRREKRSGYNLHPGQTSHGCVTICKSDSKLTLAERAKEWEIINDAIEHTQKELVPDNRGNHKYVPGKQAKFGTLEVIDSTPPPPPPAKEEAKPKNKPSASPSTPDGA